MADVHSDTVFLLGAGVVDRAWDPIIAALAEVAPEADVHTDEQANHFLTSWVYAQRLRARRMQKGNVTPQLAEKLLEMERDDLRLKKTIADHLIRATAEKTYRLRRLFVQVVGRPCWDGGGGRIFLTANWDRLLEVELALPKSSVVHIHGVVDEHSCIYLPSETSYEAHRSDEANQRIGKFTGTAWHVIQATRRLCIYGLSLSALDAELSWIVRVGLEAHTGKTLRIHLFDLRAELPKLEWRVRLLLPRNSDIQIEGHPVDEEAVATGFRQESVNAGLIGFPTR